MLALSDPTGAIRRIFRAGKGQVEELRGGEWTRLCDIEDSEWGSLEKLARKLSPLERQNLKAYLSTGQREIPGNLELSPPERFKKWRCPECETFTVIPIIIGLPSYEMMEAQKCGDVILWGCTMDGSEPLRPVGCTDCGWYGEHTRGRHIREIDPVRGLGD